MIIHAKRETVCSMCNGSGEIDSYTVPVACPACDPSMQRQNDAGAIPPSAPVEVEKALDVLEQAAKGGSIINTQLVWGGDVDKAIRTVRAALAQQSAPPSAPVGWKLVPVEPTPEMRQAYHDVMEAHESATFTTSPDDQWDAMLAAAPALTEARNVR